jgi:hypothetical protein
MLIFKIIALKIRLITAINKIMLREMWFLLFTNINDGVKTFKELDNKILQRFHFFSLMHR